MYPTDTSKGLSGPCAFDTTDIPARTCTHHDDAGYPAFPKDGAPPEGTGIVYPSFPQDVSAEPLWLDASRVRGATTVRANGVHLTRRTCASAERYPMVPRMRRSPQRRPRPMRLRRIPVLPLATSRGPLGEKVRVRAGRLWPLDGLERAERALPCAERMVATGGTPHLIRVVAPLPTTWADGGTELDGDPLATDEMPTADTRAATAYLQR